MLAGTLASVGMWAIVLVLPAVQDDFAVSRATASIAFTASMAGFALGNLLLGRAVDRFGIAPVLAGSSVTLAFCFAVSAQLTSFWIFAALQIAIGFATAAGFAPLIADISHWFVKRRGIAVACTACGNYLAGASWPQILKTTLENEGWRPAFLIIAVICLVALPPLAMLLRRRPLAEMRTDAVVSQFGTTTSPFSPRMLQILLAIAGIGCCVAMAMPQVHIVAYCTDLGYGITAGAQMLSTMLAAGIASRLFFGAVADRIGGVWTLLIGSVLQCMALFLYLPFDGLMSLYIVSLVFGLSQGGIVPSYALIVREFLPAREAGRRIGVVITATVVGMAFGGWLSGLIYDVTGSYQAAFLNGVGWNFLNIGIMVAILVRSQNVRRAFA